MWTVLFSGDVYDRMRGALLGGAPLENGCFLLSKSYRAGGRSVLLVGGMMEPDGSSWNHRSEVAIEPDSSFVNRCAVAAGSAGSGLVFVHTHPDPRHEEGFSRADREANGRMLGNLAEILPGRPVGSIVLGQDWARGAVLYGGKTQGVSAIRAIGKTLREIPASGRKAPPAEAGGMFDRQTRALGREVHGRIRGMAVTVVGAGGIGSAVAVQLARMGVGKMRLVDRDVIEDTNVPGVYGSSADDVGSPKVEVVKSHIATFSDTEVAAEKADVSDERAARLIMDSDAVFSCTDNFTSRARINCVCLRCRIPLIDSGCRIVPAGGAMEQAAAVAQVVVPGGPCLWCNGTLDQNAVLAEAAPGGEEGREEVGGYYDPDGNQPSVVSLTTLAASMAVNKLLCLLGAYGGEYHLYTRTELCNSFTENTSHQAREGCICGSISGECDDLAGGGS